MSVFDLPRLHFAGTATTKLPTGPRCGRIDLATLRALTDEGPFPADRPAAEYHAYLERLGPRFGPDGRPSPEGEFSVAKGWNFDGNGHFWMDARVVAVEGPDGRFVDTATGDPAVGRSVDVWGHYNPYLRTTVNRARIFDLDPASRWTTALMTGRFSLGRLGRSHDDGYLLTGSVGGVQPPRWADFGHVLDVGDHVLAPQLRYCAVHQFAIARDEGLEWLPDAGISPAVGALRAAVDGGADGIVVRFALDNMSTPVAPDLPSHWRVRGTVAPWYAHELRTYPAGRLLVPTARVLHHLTVEVAAGKAVFDMVSAVPVTVRAERAGPGPLHRLGPPLDAGDLELRTVGTDRLVARVPAGAYPGDATSGIVTVPAEPGWRAAEDEALRLTGRLPGGPRVTLLAEREVNIQSDEAFVVLHHRDRDRGLDHAVGVPLRSYVRGRPASAGTVRVRQYFNPRALPGDTVAGSPGARCGDAVLLGMRAEGAYAEECAVETDSRGHGLLTLRGERAGTCRVLLSAGLSDGPDGLPDADPAAPGSAWAAYDDEDALGFWAGAGALAVRVLPDDWHLDGVPAAEVDFALLHREVFAYYEHTSTFMKSEVFSLADRCKVDTYAELIWQMCDPRNKGRTYYMPPTRDLTDAKARLLLAYLRNRQERPRPPVFVPAAARERPGIRTRGELWSVLKQAAELELAVMLQYLYAAFSVPAHGAGRELVRRGLWTERQLELACGRGGETADDGIRGRLLTVAREEMIHFLLVNNIITALGEPFHVPVVDFGTVNSLLPVPLDFALEPLGIGSVQRFIAIEQPAGLVPDVRRADGGAPAPAPPGFTWGSVSELYAGIREGLRRVPGLFLVEKGRGGGEHHLFLRASVEATHPDYQLEVDDLSSALFAVDLVTEQGEGGVMGPDRPPEESHFRTFLRIGEMLTTERTEGPYGRLLPWSPAYPALRNPTLGTGDGTKTTVTDPEAREVLRIFNRSYHLMLQLMAQHFGESPDGSLRRSKLMNASIDVMTGVMRPLAELLVTMESGRRGRTAGPSFELETPPTRQPRPDVARRSLALRFEHLAVAARRSAAIPAQVPEMMQFYAEFFRREGAR
ncbi:ferritin-like domain-containing protein [Streptomyces sp. NPDC002537]